MIDWQNVEVGDVVEWRNGHRETIEKGRFIVDTKGAYPVQVNDWVYCRSGRVEDNEENPYDIIAIHKPGTVGALSHEERSRLWDKCDKYGVRITEEHGVCVAYVLASGERYGEATRLEAVAKCVAAIEQQQAKESK